MYRVEVREAEHIYRLEKRGEKGRIMSIQECGKRASNNTCRDVGCGLGNVSVGASGPNVNRAFGLDLYRDNNHFSTTFSRENSTGSTRVYGRTFGR
jgi:hypothetical protein